MVEPKYELTGMVERMRHEMERFFDDFSTRKPPSVRFSPGTWTPSVDIYETEEDIIVLFELAGVQQDEIEVEIHANELIVRGERKDIRQGVKRSYSQMEIFWGPFERRIVLQTLIEADSIKAFYDNGFLEVILPKSNVRRSHKINIRGVE
ncbi:MAG TPA: Hsp20/alpha crystallin family protein [Dehalococcoidia bacterium]|nr:Hsp20/alpha crystallin family protein [Dehalococcoidia bacterium]